MDQFLLVFLLVISYLILLFFVRHLGLGKKKSDVNCNNCCPDCQSALNRVRRTQKDQLIHHLTFRMFDARRYVCNECGWEGLRWEDQFRPGKD